MKTTNTEITLDVIDVASPCPALWEEMQGTDRVRLCADCKMNVYNLSELSTVDAEQLIREHEGRLCIRLYRRADGTILTRDCPVGLQAVRRRLARSLAAVVTLVVLLTSGTILAGLRSGKAQNRSATSGGTVTRFIRWLEPDLLMGAPIAGEMCIRPLPPAPAPLPMPPSDAPEATVQ